jgi:heme-degrading monooxygenase HmoA
LENRVFNVTQHPTRSSKEVRFAMYARITTAYTLPDRFDDAAKAVQDTFYQAARRQPGYRGFQVLTNREKFQIIGISYWESAADMQTSGASDGYYAEEMKKFLTFLTDAPSTTTFEVGLREP